MSDTVGNFEPGNTMWETNYERKQKMGEHADDATESGFNMRKARAWNAMRMRCYGNFRSQTYLMRSGLLSSTKRGEFLSFLLNFFPGGKISVRQATNRTHARSAEKTKGSAEGSPNGITHWTGAGRLGRTSIPHSNTTREQKHSVGRSCSASHILPGLRIHSSVHRLSIWYYPFRLHLYLTKTSISSCFQCKLTIYGAVARKCREVPRRVACDEGHSSCVFARKSARLDLGPTRRP